MHSYGQLDPPPDELEAAREGLRARDQLIERLAETLPVGVLHVDVAGRVLYRNDRLDEMLGSSGAATLDEQLAPVLDRDRTLAETAFDIVLHEGVDRDVELGIRPAWVDDAGVRCCTLHIRALTGQGGEVTGAVVCVSDGTESISTRDGLHLQATFDTLTRCHNRESTFDALEAMLSGSDEWSRPAVIFVDLDHFKELNEGQGHDAGDEFLGVVARRLRGAVREDDVVGRMGGDQFLVVCPDIGTAAEAVRTAIRIAESLSHEIQLKNARIGSRASIGVAWSSGSDTDTDALVAKAETAMHESKRRSTGRPVLFTPSLLQAPLGPA